MFTRIALMTLLLSFSSFGYSFTVEGRSSTSAETNTRSFIRTHLIERTRTGEISTASGKYQITSSVSLDDRRPIASWFLTPTSAEVLLEFNHDNLTSIIIY